MNRISTLIIKKLQGEISPHELEELDRFAAASEENRLLVARLTNYQTLLDDVKESYEWYPS